MPIQFSHKNLTWFNDTVCLCIWVYVWEDQKSILLVFVMTLQRIFPIFYYIICMDFICKGRRCPCATVWVLVLLLFVLFLPLSCRFSDQTQVIRLGSRHLYLLRHLTGSPPSVLRQSLSLASHSAGLAGQAPPPRCWIISTHVSDFRIWLFNMDGEESIPAPHTYIASTLPTVSLDL